MKTNLKTAVAVSIIAWSMVMAEVANAASFKFTQLLSNGNSITGEVEGTLAEDLNTVEDPVLKWWRVNDSAGEELLGGIVEETSYSETVLLFTLDGSFVDININYLEIYGKPVPTDFYKNGLLWYKTYMPYEKISIKALEEQDKYTINVIRKSFFVGFNIYEDSTFNSVTTKDIWYVSIISVQESVPEPSAILGSLLAVAAGTKVLKRGNQQ